MHRLPIGSWNEVKNLVELGSPETADLEFKQQLPPSGDESKLELRRDACAMANGGGGAIVFGIRENDGHAFELVGCEWKTTKERIHGTLARKIEPPLTYSVTTLRSDEADQSIVVLLVSDRGLVHALQPDPDKCLEFWIRRDTSKRPMTHDEIRRRIVATHPTSGAYSHINAIATWEMRARPPNGVSTFECDSDTLRAWLQSSSDICRRAGNTPEVLNEFAFAICEIFEDKLHKGGWLSNYIRIVETLSELATVGWHEPSSIRGIDHRLARIGEFGRVLSYQASRRLGGEPHLIALAAKLLGVVIQQDETAFESAVARAKDSLTDQKRYYSGSRRDCFSWVLEHKGFYRFGDASPQPELFDAIESVGELNIKPSFSNAHVNPEGPRHFERAMRRGE